MSSTEAVLVALKTVWDASALSAALKSRVYRDEKATAGVAFPYVIIDDDENSGHGSTLQGYTYRNEIWRHTFDIKVFDANKTLANTSLEAIAAVVGAAFENRSLSLSIGEFTHGKIISQMLRQDDKAVNSGTITCEVFTTRPRRR